jgi:hypothetical protein
MVRSLIIITLIFHFTATNGQLAEKVYYGGIVYKNSGIGFVYQSKLNSSHNFDKQFDLEFTNFKHSQETKTFNTEVNAPTPYVFGKLNKVALLKSNFSATHSISQFTDAQRIGIDLIAGGGITLAFLKPVYVNIIYPDPYGYEAIVSERYNPERHTNRSRIAGYTDGRVGLDEVNIKPGLSLSAGMGFTWGYFTNYPKRLETGFYLEYFKNGLPVMAFVKNKTLQNGLYIKLFMGKRSFKN